jgi:tetratricopeptide (TPR) repeat protein
VDEKHLRTDELVALVELGRLKEALQKRDEWFKRTDLFAKTQWNQGQVNLCLSMEMSANGHPADAQAVLSDAVQWYRDNPAMLELEPRPVPCNHWLAFAPLYYAGQWDDARALYQRMLARDSLSSLAHEALGAIAAHERNLDDVRRMDEWLTTHAHRETGRSTYARARIAALLGDRDRAILLLRKAFDEGLSNRMYIRLDPDLATLRNLPAYRQLFELRG